jgi:hypothetical protein
MRVKFLSEVLRQAPLRPEASRSTGRCYRRWSRRPRNLPLIVSFESVAVQDAA